MISALIPLTKAISSAILFTERVGLVAYPLERCMVTSFVFLVNGGFNPVKIKASVFEEVYLTVRNPIFFQ